MTIEFDVKLEFFIGATRRDLSKAREKLIEAVLEAKHIPSGMEIWAAGVDPLLDDISRYLERCDAHIIVLGARYGEYIKGKEISFTEWEYRESKNKRHIIAFLLKDEEFKISRKKELDRDPNEREKEDKLRDFRNELMSSRLCKFFSNTKAGIEELGKQCVNAIHQLINEKAIGEHSGWIRAGGKEASTLRQIRNNKFLERELIRLSEFSIIGDRVVLERNSKEVMGNVFWNVMKGRIRRQNWKHIFIESGSTLAYISEDFENEVLKYARDIPEWTIWTNNVIALLQLILNTDVHVRRFPASAPDTNDKYGAIFPREWYDLFEAPPAEPRPLHYPESLAVEAMKTQLSELSERKLLILATASGWDLDHSQASFRGPHVGSHPNMLFKRALFTTGDPVIILLNAEKLGDPFEVGNCYSIFGPDLPLGKAMNEYPLALCVGYDQSLVSKTRKELMEGVRKDRNDPERVNNTLRTLGFNIAYNLKYPKDRGAIIAGNEKFKELLPND